VGGGGGHDADAEPVGQPGQHGISFIVQRMPVTRELDADPMGAEPIHQIGQRRTGRFWTSGRECLADMALAAPGENLPVPAGSVGECVVVVPEHSLRTAGQMRGSQLARQSPVPLGAAGQYQQVRTGRIGRLGARDTTERQLGTEHRCHVEFTGGLGEPDHAVETVVVGQRDGLQVNRAASSTSSSGVLAPSRKLYAECACNSA
jgi:hypothetical protein